MKIDKEIFDAFDLFSARLVLDENIIDDKDYITLFNIAKEHYKTTSNSSITNNFFVAFVTGYYYALNTQH